MGDLDILVVALVAVPFVPDVRESGILLVPGFVWKAVPLVAGARGRILLATHAAGGDMRLCSASLLLPVDFHVGHQLDRMFRVEELCDYLARPGRPMALIDRRYWRDFQRELPPDLVVLEKIPIQGRSCTS